MAEQAYDPAGDALIADGGWWCTHDDSTARWLTDTLQSRTVTCDDCGTVWVPWTNPSGRRAAKPVVTRA